jgi:hypothetical protein
VKLKTDLLSDLGLGHDWSADQVDTIVHTGWDCILSFSYSTGLHIVYSVRIYCISLTVHLDSLEVHLVLPAQEDSCLVLLHKLPIRPVLHDRSLIQVEPGFFAHQRGSHGRERWWCMLIIYKCEEVGRTVCWCRSCASMRNILDSMIIPIHEPFLLSCQELHDLI